MIFNFRTCHRDINSHLGLFMSIPSSLVESMFGRLQWQQSECLHSGVTASRANTTMPFLLPATRFRYGRSSYDFVLLFRRRLHTMPKLAKFLPLNGTSPCDLFFLYASSLLPFSGMLPFLSSRVHY